MEQKEIDRLIRCRKAIDYFLVYYPHVDESYDQCVFYIKEELKKEGFESLKEFVDYNYSICLEEYQRCHPLRGSCDYCGEDELKVQPCIKKFGMIQCSNRAKGTGVDRGGQEYAFYLWQNNLGIIRNGKRVSHCLDGHGYYEDMTEDKEFSFDVCWDVPNGKPANSNWTKQEFEKVGKIKSTVRAVSIG